MSTEKTLSITEKEYWLDVSDCPLSVWEARYDRGNSELRKKQPKKKKKKANPKKDERRKLMDYEAWDILFKSFVQKVGLEKDFTDYILLIRRLVDTQHRYLMSERMVEGVLIADRKILGEINRINMEIHKYEKSGVKGQTINGTLNKISKMQGYREHKKDLTVLQYFSLVNDYKKWLKT